MSLKKEIEDIVFDIGKIILLNGNFVKNKGLFNGQSGASIFIYNLERYKENDIFFNFANDLVLNITENLSGKDYTYTTGMAGICWCLDHLIKNDFLDSASAENIFFNTDTKIINRFSGPDLQNIQAYGTCAYFYSRLEKEDFRTDPENIQPLLMQEIVIGLLDKMYNVKIPLHTISKDLFISNIESELYSRDLAFQVEVFLKCAIIIKKSILVKTFPAVTDVLLVMWKITLRKLLQFSEEYIIDKNPDLSDSKQFFYNIYLKLCLAYKQLSPFIKDENEWDPLPVLQKLSKKKNTNNLNQADLLILEMNNIHMLSRINKLCFNKQIEELLHEEIGALLTRTRDRKAMVESFSFNKDINIGISGLAGLGLLFLEQIHPELGNWDEALLLN